MKLEAIASIADNSGSLPGFPARQEFCRARPPAGLRAVGSVNGKVKTR